MPRPKVGKIGFATRLDPELVELLHQWAAADRRTLSEALSLILTEEAARRAPARKPRQSRTEKT